MEPCLLHYIPRHDVRRGQVYISSLTFKTLCLYVNCGLKAETTTCFTTKHTYMFHMTLRTNTRYLLKQNTDISVFMMKMQCVYSELQTDAQIGIRLVFVFRVLITPQ